MSAEQWEELECEWKIQLSVGKRIQIFWTTFELLKNNCHMEYVEVTFFHYPFLVFVKIS